MDKKSSTLFKNKKIQIAFVLSAILVLALIIVSFILIVSKIQNTILNLDIKNTVEISYHDNKLASNSVNDIWEDMDAVVSNFKAATNITDTQDIIDFTKNSKPFIQNCIDIAFVTSDGYFYGLNDTQPVLQEDVLYILKLEYEKYILRTDNKKVLSEAFGNNKIFLYEKFTPFTISGLEFNYIACTLSVDAIQKTLSTNSYKGNGSSFIIDNNGYYVDDRSLTEEDNYFEYLESYSFDGYSSINDLIKDIRNINDYLSLVIRKGDSLEIVVFSPIENTNWVSVSTLPKETYDEQTDTFLQWTWISIGFIMLIVLIFLAFLYIFIKKLMSQRVAKEYTAQIEEKNNQLEIKQEELSNALDEAKQASQAKTSFLFNMSHDIRTPMNAILGYASIAKKNMDDKDKVESNLNKVEDSGKKLLYIINDILDMSRIEAGKWNIEEKSTNIYQSIKSDCDAFFIASKNNGTIFTSDININHKYAIIDEQHISRIITNVVTNSIKYTLPGGSINLAVYESESDKEGYGKFTFICEDTGIGIDKEYLPHIFEAFSREANTTKSGIQGTGLGMAITKQLTDILGGTINIESEKGKGTKTTVVFDFKLDLDAKDESIESKEESNVSTNALDALKGKKILIVDDNDINREILKEILEEEGFVCGEASDGDIAVDMLKNSSSPEYNLILMDIQMPRMNGYEATIAIRHLDNKDVASLPIIACSANAFADDIKKSLDSGMNAHISKPLDLKQLNELLIQFIC